MAPSIGLSAIASSANLSALHRALGVHAERYPLSGASRFRNSGHDLDLYINGPDTAPAVAECKARKNGAGLDAVIERQLGSFDALVRLRSRITSRRWWCCPGACGRRLLARGGPMTRHEHIMGLDARTAHPCRCGCGILRVHPAPQRCQTFNLEMRLVQKAARQGH